MYVCSKRALVNLCMNLFYEFYEKIFHTLCDASVLLILILRKNFTQINTNLHIVHRGYSYYVYVCMAEKSHLEGFSLSYDCTVGWFSSVGLVRLTK